MAVRRKKNWGKIAVIVLIIGGVLFYFGRKYYNENMRPKGDVMK